MIKQYDITNTAFINIREALDKFDEITRRESGEITEDEENFVKDFDLYFAAALRKDYLGTVNLGKILTIMGEQ